MASKTPTKKRKKTRFPPEILCEVPQAEQWASATAGNKQHKQKLSKYRYVTKSDKRKVATGPQFAAKIFVFNEGVAVGHYETEEEAAREADKAVLFYRHRYPNSGKLWLNFPLASYPAAVRNGQVLPDTPLVKNMYGDSFVKAGAQRRAKLSEAAVPHAAAEGGLEKATAAAASSSSSSSALEKGGPRHVGKTGVMKGTGRYKGKFGAYISIKNKRIDLGYSDTPEEAARVYDIASLRYRGPHAPLNYPRNKYTYQQVYAKALPGNWNDGRTVANAVKNIDALVEAELDAVERRHYWELLDWKIRADKYEKELIAAKKKIAAFEAGASSKDDMEGASSKKVAAVAGVAKQRMPVTAAVAADVGRGWFHSTNYKKEMAGVPNKKRRRLDPQYENEVKKHRAAAGYGTTAVAAVSAAPILATAPGIAASAVMPHAV